MTRDLPPPLKAHSPVVRKCGFCSHWKVPAQEASVLPRADAGMDAMGMRPCAKSHQSWRYFGATHACHLPD